MSHSVSEIYSNHFYAWEQLYSGSMVYDAPVPVNPPFQQFKRFDFASTNVADDSLVPTHFESVSSFVRKQFKQFASANKLHRQGDHKLLQQMTTSRVVFMIYVPLECIVKNNEFEQFLQMISMQIGTVGFEIVATSEHIALQFVCDVTGEQLLSSLLAAYFPSVIVQKINDPLKIFALKEEEIEIIEFAPRHEFFLPLKPIGQSSLDPFIPLFTALDNLQPNEMVILQILLHFSDKPWKETILHALHNELGQPFFFHSPHMVQQAEQKCSHPMFGMVLRLAIQGQTQKRMNEILSGVATTIIQSTRSEVNHLYILPNDKCEMVSHVMDLKERRSRRGPFVVNGQELLSFVHVPGTTVISKKYRSAFTRTKAVPAEFKNHAFVLGCNNHAGLHTKITVGPVTRLRHTNITGASGMGKSNLLLSMMREDFRLGNGLCLIDPHGPLVDAVLKYIPDQRKHDVVILDPSDQEFPFSLNILKAFSECEREVLASDLTSAFRKNSLSWGDGLNSIFANAISVFLYSSRGGTLADVRRFLLDKQFRDAVLKTVGDQQLVYYWKHEFPLLRMSSVGSILTRLDTFLRPKAIRNMVVQPNGFDFESLLNNRKILLVKLPLGVLGSENAYLLGSLLITKIYQAALARQELDTLNDFFLYIDEFHHFLSSTTSVLDILSGARKFHVSLITASQSLSQIKEPAIVDSILTNVATRICFRLGESDAKKFAEGFSSFTAYDLQNLKVGEAICRIDRPEQDFSLQVELPGEPLCDENDIAQMIEHSQQSYCVRRDIVEERLLESISPSATTAIEKYETENAHLVSQQHSLKAVEKEIQSEGVELVRTDRKQRSHREIQIQIKQIAESFGYTATVEQQLPDGAGQVDVLLTKEGKTIAVEISVRTGRKWEVHNIEKCIAANYDVVISLSQSERQAQQIKKEFEQKNLQTSVITVHFFTPDTFIAFLQQEQNPIIGNKKVRGYDVKISYENPN